MNKTAEKNHIPFGAASTCIARVREYSPPPGVGFSVLARKKEILKHQAKNCGECFTQVSILMSRLIGADRTSPA